MATDLLERDAVPTTRAHAATMEHYPLTPNGNGDRFAALHKGEVLLYQNGRSQTYYSLGPSGRWMRNEGKLAGDVERRARDVLLAMAARAGALIDAADAALAQDADDSDAKKKRGIGLALQKWVTACDSLPAMRLMIQGGCLSHRMTVDPEDEFDIHTHLLATPSGVLELGKGTVELRPIRSKDMITMSTTVSYKPEILQNPPELIKQYLETFLPDDQKVKLLFQALGSALLGGNSQRILIVLQGKIGTNGKTQLVEAIRETLGSYAGVGNPSIFRGNLEDKPRPDLLKVLKNRMAFFAEASKNWELHGDRLKALTGGDGLSVRRMRSEDHVEVVPHFTPVIYTNEMPRVSGMDRALRRRLLVIEFDRSPTVEDPDIKTRFLASVEVREWLLAALVKGYLATSLAGLSEAVKAFAQLSEESFQASGHLGEFFTWLEDSDQVQIADHPDPTKWGAKSTFVTLKEMHARYMFWVRNHGSKRDVAETLSYVDFNNQLRDVRSWTTVNSGSKRWEGKVLLDLPAMWLD